MTAMSPKEILKFLPHGYPFLLVDRTEAMVTAETAPVGNYVIGYKGVTINEPFFQGHFPDNPVMPGVLILEALMQVTGIVICKSINVDPHTIGYFLTSVDKAKFRTPVIPGTMLRLKSTLRKVRSKKFFYADTQAFIKVDGSEDILAAEAQVSGVVLKRE